MRVFYLRLTKADFATTYANKWQTSQIDLYNNNWYKNYSTIKSFYGMPQTAEDWPSNRKYPWTGIENYEFSSSDDYDDPQVGYDGSGEFEDASYLDYDTQSDYDDPDVTQGGQDALEDTRYIDVTGPINIVNYVVQTSFSYTGNTTVDIALSSDDSQHPEEWIYNTGFTQVGEINIDNSDRYAQFSLNFDKPIGNDAIFYVRVEIDRPVMAPKYTITQQVLNKFPEWMAIREADDEIFHATPQLALPLSLGGALVNAVSGEWLEDLKLRIRDGSADMFIDTVNLDQMAWCYRTTNVPEFVYSIVGDGHIVGLAGDIGEFYEASEAEYVAFWDENTQTIYCNQLFDSFNVNQHLYSQELSRVWNALDEIGLSVDLPRLSNESNEWYQARILDVFRNPLGTSSNSLKLALRRELNMWQLHNSTPDSNFQGATPEILEISDIELDPNYIFPNGLPRQRFLDLVNQLAVEYPMTWGYFKWDNMLWDMGGTDYSGFTVLPRSFDPQVLTDPNTQSGVGDGDDLLLFRPDQVTGPHDFTAEVTLRGKQAVTQVQYPPVDLTIEVQGFANRIAYNNPANSVWFTVEMLLIADDATPSFHTYFSSFLLTSTSNVDVANSQPGPASFASMEIINSNGLINPNFTFYNKLLNSGSGIDVLGRTVDSSEVASIRIVVGQWNIASGSYTNFPGLSNQFTAWLSNDPTTTVVDNSATLFVGNNLSTPTELPRVSVIMSSNQTSSSTSTWYSEKFTIPVTVNADPDITQQSPTTVALPSINWDQYVTGTKWYQISITSNNGEVIPQYGGLVHPLNGDPFYINSSQIALNGSTNWSNGYLQSLQANSTSALVFSIGSSPAYPITDNLWEPYTSAPFSISGTVDENGPWVNGFAPPLGAGNSEHWVTLTLDRTDFNIPNNDNYIINWIGVTTDNPDVIAWVDTSTVIPSVTDGGTTYPAGSIVETNLGNDYHYSPFTINAKLNPSGVPQWYPNINAGTFYERQQEYYLYAKGQQQTTSNDSLILDNASRQGAPIIVKTSGATPNYLRQVTFFDDSQPPSYNTPTQLTLTNAENVSGTGGFYLYASYPNINSITVTDITDPITPVVLVPSFTAISDNVVFVQSVTDITHTYTLTYQVTGSFYADNSYLDALGNQHTLIQFDATPATPGFYTVDYETAELNNTSTVPVALNPLYTNVEKGFLFISHDEYTLDDIVLTMNPGKIVANGRDYLSLVIQSVDLYGNPKPTQSFNISTTYGVLSASTVTTNVDGYASVILTSTTSEPVGNIDPITLLPQGIITITGTTINNTIKFLVDVPSATPNKIYAVISQDQIPADGISQNVVYGKVFDSNANPVPYAYVHWKKARSNYELFASSNYVGGNVTAGADGTFVIGPFSSATPSGYWYMSTESQAASPNITFPIIGDEIYWYEYNPSIFGVDNMNGLPPAPIQAATPIGLLPPYAYGNFYPVSYSETVFPPTVPIVHPILPTNTGHINPVTAAQLPFPPPYTNPAQAQPILQWLPPRWYALPKYHQYQLGLTYLNDEHDTGGEV